MDKVFFLVNLLASFAVIFVVFFILYKLGSNVVNANKVGLGLLLFFYTISVADICISTYRYLLYKKDKLK